MLSLREQSRTARGTRVENLARQWEVEARERLCTAKTKITMNETVSAVLKSGYTGTVTVIPAQSVRLSEQSMISMSFEDAQVK